MRKRTPAMVLALRVHAIREEPLPGHPLVVWQFRRVTLRLLQLLATIDGALPPSRPNPGAAK